MPIQSRILDMIEAVLQNALSPEDVCRDAPEALPELRRRLGECRQLASDLDDMFPLSGSPDSSVWVENADSGDGKEEGATFPSVPRHRIEAVIGRGGMGIVYRALNLPLNRVVALKTLRTGVYATAAERARFIREGQALASLRHPHVVPVHEAADHAGQPYFTMELVEGGSLSTKLAGAPLPAMEAARIVEAIASAVQAAHDAGIVHRDLKPANVLLTSDGTPKVSDFGLVQSRDAARSDESTLTEIGQRLGTPSYMAPEQASPRWGEIGPLSDVYGIGAILYETLTGRPPFRGDSPAETERQLLSDDPVPLTRLLPRVPPDLDTICLKCLQKLPERRYPSAAELAADLARFLRGEPILARPVGVVEKLVRWTRRHRGLAASLAAVVVLMVTLVIGSVVAAAYFQRMGGVQRRLALEKGKLATEETQARLKAVEAQGREYALHKQAEAQGEELRYNLYLAQMHLAGEAARASEGIGRVHERLIGWESSRPDLRGWEWYYLDGLCHRDLMTLRGHAGNVFHVCWSPDGRGVASASADGTMKVWDAADGRRILSINAHSSPVHTVAWSPDGRWLATAGWDHTVKVWNAASGSLAHTFRAHSGRALSVAWRPDGARLASAGDNGTILVWDVADGRVAAELHGHDGAVYTLAWTRDGRRLASGSEDATIRIWDVAAAKELATLDGHSNWVRQVAWNRDCTRLASASNDTTAKIWDVGAGKELITLRGHSNSVSSIAWSSDDSRLATCSDDQTVKLWNAAEGTETVTLRGHIDSVNSVAWHPDGSRLASASSDETVKIWDAGAPMETPALNGHAGSVTSISWSPDGAELASASSDSTARVWDASTFREQYATPPSTGGLNTVAWSPNGKYVAIAGEQPSIEIWDVASRSRLLTCRPQPAGQLHCVTWSPNSRLLASAGDDGRLRVWDATTGEELRSIAADEGEVHTVAWSPNGETLASGGTYGWVKLWQAKTGSPLSSARAHRAPVRCVAWSPDGQWIASAGGDHAVAIISAASGAVAMKLKWHTGVVNAVAWSFDGKRLASGGEDRTVRIWDATTGKGTLVLGPGPSEVTSLAWNPDGMRLAVGEDGHNISIYDASAGYRASWSTRILPTLEARLAADPRRASDWRLRAQVHAAQGNWDEAAADLQRYLALKPDEHWSTLGYWLAGPYPEDLAAHFPPETQLEPNHSLAGSTLVSERAVAWQSAPANAEGFVNLGLHFDNAEHISAYAMLKVYCPARELPVTVLLGAHGEVRLWFNGRQIYENLKQRPAVPNAGAVPITLGEGWNTLLARVANVQGAHILYLRLSDAASDMARVNTTR